MNVRRKILAGSTALGLFAGVSLAAGAPTQAAVVDRVVALECSGDDSVLPGVLAGAPAPSQDILNLLGQFATPPVPPPVSLPIQAQVGIEVPDELDPGESGPVAFSSQILLPETLVASLEGFGVTQVPVQNITLGVGASNNTGAPLVVNPANFTIDLTVDPVVPPVLGPFEGTVTPDLPGTPIVYTVETVSFGVAVTTTLGAVSIGLSCTAADGVLAETRVTGTPPPTVAPTTTTTTAPAPRALTQPRFTG